MKAVYLAVFESPICYNATYQMLSNFERDFDVLNEAIIGRCDQNMRNGWIDTNTAYLVLRDLPASRS